MSLADRLGDLNPAEAGLPCGIAVVLEALPDADRVALVDALARPKGDRLRLSARQISEALRSEGHRVSLKTVEIHRKGACRCEPCG